MPRQLCTGAPRRANSIALAVLVGLCASGDVRAQTLRNNLLSNAAEARAALDGFKEEDNKLRAAFRELTLEYRKALSRALTRDYAQAAANDRRLPADVRQRNSSVYRQLDEEMKQFDARMREKEAKFKEDQNRLLERMKEQAPLAIRLLSQSVENRTTAALIQFTELFVFDPKQEVPALRVSTSFLDHDCWLAAANALAKQGMVALPQRKRALQSPQVAARYAAAVALGEIGPAVDREDKTIYSEMSALRSKNWGSNLDRTERDRRAKLLQEAIDRIHPPKK